MADKVLLGVSPPSPFTCHLSHTEKVDSNLLLPDCRGGGAFIDLCTEPRGKLVNK